MTLTKSSRIFVQAGLLGISLSSFIGALMLMTLISRYSKDLNEVAATWEYVQTGIVTGALTLAGWWVSRKGQGSL